MTHLPEQNPHLTRWGASLLLCEAGITPAPKTTSVSYQSAGIQNMTKSVPETHHGQMEFTPGMQGWFNGEKQSLYSTPFSYRVKQESAGA